MCYIDKAFLSVVYDGHIDLPGFGVEAITIEILQGYTRKTEYKKKSLRKNLK